MRRRPRGARRLSGRRADRPALRPACQSASSSSSRRSGIRGCHSPATRPDHGTGVELATIDAHRAAEAAADLERRLDDGVARETRQHRFEIRDFAGGLRQAIPFLLVRSRWVREVLNSMRTNGKTVLAALVLPGGQGGSLPLRLDIQREKRKRHVGDMALSG